jgi:hypothetical protein
MDGLVCDVCGAALLADEDVRYILRIQGFAAYDPLEITKADLDRDLDGELRAILDGLERKNPEEAQDEVYRSFHFDLCPACWRRYLKDPLAGIRPLP